MHNFVHNKLPNCFENMFKVSNSSRTKNIIIEICINKSLKQFPSYLMPRIWNALCLENKNITTRNKFKKTVYEELKSSYSEVSKKCKNPMCPDCWLTTTDYQLQTTPLTTGYSTNHRPYWLQTTGGLPPVCSPKSCVLCTSLCSPRRTELLCVTLMVNHFILLYCTVLFYYSNIYLTDNYNAGLDSSVQRTF